MSTAVTTLFTGVPGQGKTLFVIDYLRTLRKAEPETPIYTHNIKWTEKGKTELNVIELQDDQIDNWRELPKGSVVVFDECQGAFPKRPNGSKVPDKCAAFETLRHRGHRAILVTQHHGNFDSHVANMVGAHTHVERIAGSQSANLITHRRAFNPTNKADRKNAEKTIRAYPKELYDYYVSAEVHTVKFKMPKAFKLVIFALVFALAAVSFGVYRATHVKDSAAEAFGLKKEDMPKESPASAPVQGQPFKSGKEDKPMTKEEYFASLSPRVPGFPNTAPRYDGMNGPARAPKPVSCVKNEKRCSCYTQDATAILGMTKAMCEDIVQNGYFDDTIADHTNQVLPASGSLPAARTPVSPASQVGMINSGDSQS